MSSKETDESNSVNMTRCPLHDFGCTDLFSPDQLSKHQCTPKHLNILIRFIRSEEVKYDDALIELTRNPFGTDHSSNMATSIINNYEQFMGQFTDIILKKHNETQLTTAAASSSSNFDQIYSGTESTLRGLIGQMDRDPNYADNLASYQMEAQLNTSNMDNISNSVDALLIDDSANDHVEQNPGPVLANEQQSNTQFYQITNSMLQNELQSRPVSTNGYLIWRIAELFNKIQDAISRRKQFIDSPYFQTTMDGDQFSVRVYLDGGTDLKFIRINIYRTCSLTNSFRGTIKVALVDQSLHGGLEHHIKEYDIEATCDNPCIHSDDFIDKSLVHQEGSRFVHDDSICLIIYIPQTFQQKFANFPANVQDALTQLTQAS